MLIGNINFNEEFFKGWTYDKFKDYFEKAGFIKKGLKPEQVAKQLGIEIPKEK